MSDMRSDSVQYDFQIDLVVFLKCLYEVKNWKIESKIQYYCLLMFISSFHIELEGTQI